MGENLVGKEEVKVKIQAKCGHVKRNLVHRFSTATGISPKESKREKSLAPLNFVLGRYRHTHTHLGGELAGGWTEFK